MLCLFISLLFFFLLLYVFSIILEGYSRNTLLFYYPAGVGTSTYYYIYNSAQYRLTSVNILFYLFSVYYFIGTRLVIFLFSIIYLPTQVIECFSNIHFSNIICNAKACIFTQLAILACNYQKLLHISFSSINVFT